MNAKYEIAAHPTLYRGIQFRSRLEARYAAYFDLHRWEWQYEPIDLKGWTPDFLLKLACNREGKHELLCEVKPYLTLAEFDGHPVCEKYWSCVEPAPAKLGYHPSVSGFCVGCGDGGGEFSLVHHGGSWELWDEAGNIVQWKP